MIYVGVGGNLGGDAELLSRFARARAELERRRWSAALRSSPVYRSDPVGRADQPRFLNAVLAVEPPDQPVEPARILEDLLAVEAALGRVRAEPGGPRTIDLDLLLCGSEVSGAPGLQLPHPRMHQRGFVLRPLADLAGEELVVPGVGRTVGELLREPEVEAQRIERLTDVW